MVLLFAMSFCQAQGKYGYAAYFDHGKYYISYVKDLTKLNVPSVSRKSSYGEKLLTTYYSDCLKKWFYDLLISKGVTVPYIDNLYISVNTPNQYTGCTGNEDSCFMSQSLAEKGRKEDINTHAIYDKIVEIE